MWAISVCSDRRNFFRAGTLKNRSRTAIAVPPPRAISSQLRILPPAISTLVPVCSSSDRVSSSSRETDAIDGSASPRKPSVAIEAGLSHRAVCWWRGAQMPAGVVAKHAAAIVGDADQPPAAGLDFHPYIRRARIQRILQQLFDNGCRPFHHLARGDLLATLSERTRMRPTSLL